MFANYSRASITIMRCKQNCRNSSIGVRGIIVLVNFVLGNAPVKSKGNVVGITNCVSAVRGGQCADSGGEDPKHILLFYNTVVRTAAQTQYRQ